MKEFGASIFLPLVAVWVVVGCAEARYSIDQGVSDTEPDTTLGTNGDKKEDCENDLDSEEETTSPPGSDSARGAGELHDSATNVDSASVNGFDKDSDSEEDDCDTQELKMHYVSSKLMILLDRSWSMGSNKPPTKWNQARKALTYLLTNWSSGALPLEFGFDVFPDDNSCGTSKPVIVDSASGTGGQILDYLADNEVPPDGTTPLCEALRRFNRAEFPHYAPGFTSLKSDSYLVLVSDGEDTCGGLEYVCAEPKVNASDNKKAQAEHLRGVTSDLLFQGIKTFVIGFGEEADAAELNAIAESGGTSITTYFDVQDQDGLEFALETIAASAVGCTYIIAVPEDTVAPDRVNLFFNDVVIPWDKNCNKQRGWDWSGSTGTTVEFCEQSCNRLKAGNVKKIRAEFGCPTIVVI